MRRLVGTAVVVTGLVLIALGPPAVAQAAVAPSTTPSSGTISVQTTSPSGQTVAAVHGNVNLSLANGDPVQAGEADSSGHITFTGVPAGSGYEVDIAFRSGAPRFDGTTRGITVTAGQTSPVAVVVALGGSIGGLLTSPQGNISGTEVEADNLTTGTISRVFVDDSNRYLVQGLATGLYRFSSFSGGPTEPYEWLEDVQQETTTQRATFTSNDNRYVHTDYDLELTLGPPVAGETAPSTWDDATVRATNVGTSAAFSETTDSTSSSTKLTQFETPSGAYTVEILPRGGATPLWYAGPGAALTPSAGAAAHVTVAFGHVLRITGH